MLAILKQPYPYNTDLSYKLTVACAFGVFITGFLFVFAPFGIEGSGESRLPIAVAYGAITFVGCIYMFIFMPVIFPKLFREEKWTVTHEILFSIWIFLTIGTLNFLYTAFKNYSPSTWEAYFGMLSVTLLVGAVPLSIYVLFKQVRLLKKTLSSAEIVTQNISVQSKNLHTEISLPTIIHSENGKESFDISNNETFFIGAAENYIEIFWQAGGQPKKTLLRNSMKRIEWELSCNPEFCRCHRSYIVNLMKVRRVEGNAQGYRLYFEGIHESVPVSRNYIPLIDAFFKRNVSRD